MSYDLAVWVGPRPESAAAAGVEYERRMDEVEALEEDDEAAAPTAAPELVAFVEAALARFPQGPNVDSPWASSPLAADIVGDLLSFPLTFSGATYARDELAELAVSRGLVCYDPQVEDLLPNPDATPASAFAAQADAALRASFEADDALRRRGWLRRFLRPGG